MGKNPPQTKISSLGKLWWVVLSDRVQWTRIQPLLRKPSIQDKIHYAISTKDIDLSSISSNEMECAICMTVLPKCPGVNLRRI